MILGDLVLGMEIEFGDLVTDTEDMILIKVVGGMETEDQVVLLPGV